MFEKQLRVKFYNLQLTFWFLTIEQLVIAIFVIIMALAEACRGSIVERRNFLAPSLKLDDQKYEFVFVLDRSGSMWGPSIELCRRACELFLRSLPTTCYFNVIGFGTNFELLFPKSVAYTQENVSKAISYAQGMQANMGENEIDLPLKHIYGQTQIPGYLTQIFVITDGCQEFRTPRIDQIVSVISSHKSFARVFSLGIGNQVSEELVKKLAVNGGGTSCFVAMGEKIETKILQQLQFSLKPSLLKPLRVS